MQRKSPRVTALSILLVAAIGVFVALAAETPVVLQPSDPAFSASDRAALNAAINDIVAILNGGFPISKSSLVRRGWVDRDFVVFVAGYLESSGYTTNVVEGKGDSGADHLWVLVEIPLAGTSTWIPVEAVPSAVDSYSHLGVIPWADGSAQAFDAANVAFDRVIELEATRPATVRISFAGGVAVYGSELYVAAVSNPSGVFAYVWTIEGDEETYVETGRVFRYAFRQFGEFQMTVVVYDRWGGLPTATTSVDVLEEPRDCGCG